MVERRSLGDAITPEKLAFIKGGESKVSLEPEKVKVIETTLQPAEESKPLENKAKRSRRSTREEQEPEPADVLNQILVSITNRFQHRTVQALRRAHLERKLKNIQPNTQQEIIEMALQEWLTERGYLE